MTRSSMCTLAVFVTLSITLNPLAARAAGPTSKPAPASKPSAEFSDALEKAIKELTTQADTYTNKPGTPVLFVFSRPQKVVSDLKPDNAAAVLERMLKPFTNHEWKDSYIRWHLMPLILSAPESQRKAMAKNLVDLSKLVTAPEVFLEIRESVFDEPKDIADKYRGLVNQCVFYKGFPPFQVPVGPPDSFQYMDAERKKKCEAMWAEAQTLVGKFKTRVDQTAQAWNNNRGWTPWWQQMYRGEVFQSMIRTGDVPTLNAAMAWMAVQTKQDPLFGCEMISFLNASYANGEMGVYDLNTMKSVAAKVLALGKANQKWVGAAKGRYRNLGESAFNFVKAVELDRVVPTPTKDSASGPEIPKPAATTQPHATPDNLDIEMINAAVARAEYALAQHQPPDINLTYLNWAVLGIQYYPYHLLYSGTQSLGTWALLAAGESYQSPWMQKRVNWSLADDTTITYDRAMRLQILQLLPRKGWEDWVKRDRDGLIASITNEGNFPERWMGEKPFAEGFSENANGQYGVMGLMASEALRQPVPIEAWKKIDKYWREAQFRSPKAADGGWSQISFKSLKSGVDPGVVGKVSGPMTAAGILALSQTERFINAKNTDVGQGFSPQLLGGIKWLNENFNLEGASEADQDWFYYMWTIQNVGHATGYRRLKGIDWYREATAKLLNSQAANGSWTGPKGEQVSTSFALLYLYRARGPLAISKLHFTSTDAAKDKSTATSWNNRPNDLVNFCDYLTETYETPTSWLVVERAQPVVELIESPTIYLATDKGFTLSEDDVAKLRAYTEAGGLLIAAPEGNKPAPPLASMKALAKQLFPDRELEKLETSHPFYSLAAKVKGNYPMEAVSNGIRPLMVIVEKDLGRDLQANKEIARDSFALLGNIYLYAAGRDARRPRLAGNYVVMPTTQPSRKIAAARIKYEGDFDPEPQALPQLSAVLARNHGIKMTVESIPADQLDPGKQFAFLTVSPKTNLTDAQTAALRKWLDAGGTLWVDVAGGDEGAGAQLDSITPRLVNNRDAYHSLHDQKILTGIGLTGGYDVHKLMRRKFGTDRGRDPIMVVTLDDRPAIFVSRVDIDCGLAGLNHWGIAGYEPTTARRLVINSILNNLAIATTRPTTAPEEAKAETKASTVAAAAKPTTKPTTNP